jgi:hypothetical protein
MTETPSEPDWTRRCKVTDLNDLRGQPYMLRTSDDPTSPWRSVKTRNVGSWTDRDTGTDVHYVTVEFYDDDSQRILNHTDEIEIGLIRPPWWPEGAEPQEWPRGDD